MTQERIKWHLDVPVCRTLTGLRIHLGIISLGELNGLCFLLKCDSIAALTVKMWDTIKLKKLVKRPLMEEEMYG